MDLSIAAVICAAGSSNRMGGAKKEYLPFTPGLSEGTHLTVLGAAAAAFAACPRIGPIVITIPPNGENAARANLPAELLSAKLPSGEERIMFTTGGPSRRASVHNALLRLEAFSLSHVLIHDGARPWIKRGLIEKIIDAALQYGAVIPGLPLTETPKELAPDGSVKRHLKRAQLCGAQTPQGFKFSEILTAHEKAAEKEKLENCEYTDDAEVWVEFIGQVMVIPGDPENRKITYPEDLRR